MGSERLQRPVLVLNASYEPINICAARRALVLVLKGVASADEESAIFLYVAIRHHYNVRSYLGIFTVPPFCIIRHNNVPTASRE